MTYNRTEFMFRDAKIEMGLFENMIFFIGIIFTNAILLPILPKLYREKKLWIIFVMLYYIISSVTIHMV